MEKLELYIENFSFNADRFIQILLIGYSSEKH